jgi:two-component system, chemotaxis family, protein-glutamate methylesterase/glutaminase
MMAVPNGFPPGTPSVLVVDDSAAMRQLLTAMLEAEGLQVVGSACDATSARAAIKSLDPTVVTLDVDMPGMDGLAFLEKIMTLRPTPVIMVSSLTGPGMDAAVRALELGAVDCVVKPLARSRSDLDAFAADLAAKIRVAATSRLRPPARSAMSATARTGGVGAATGHLRSIWSGCSVIAIGASTGGVERIRDLLGMLPPDCPPVVIVQHIGAGFVSSFASRLDRQSALTVRVAEDGQRLLPGHALVAPGDRHLRIARTVISPGVAGLCCRLTDDDPVAGHRPSVDVLFQSIAQSAAARAVGVLLSGMGRDGAEGLLAVRTAGSHTIGESEASCAVYGMPRAARLLDAVIEECSHDQMADAILAAAAAMPGCN